VRGAQTAQGSTVSPAADSPQPAPAVGSRGEDDASPSIRPTDQLRLLTQARALLTRRPGRSLELLDIHQRHFPDTVLDQERAALRVEALWRSGQNAAARRARTSFSTRYPNSPHSTRLEQLLDRR